MTAAAVLGFVQAALARAEEEEFDPDTVTPGVWGFVFTFLVMILVVLLILDMVRRIRRVNYRAEVRAQLEAERLEEEFGEADGQATDASAPSPDDEERPGGASDR